MDKQSKVCAIRRRDGSLCTQKQPGGATGVAVWTVGCRGCAMQGVLVM